MKILIIAYYYPPETYAMMASLRPLSWAKYWSQQGHEIQILTTAKNRSIPELTPYPNVTITEVSYNLFASSHPKVSPVQNIEVSRQPNPLQAIKVQSRNFLIFLQKILGAGTLLYASNLWIFAAYFKAQKLYQDFPYDIIVSTFSPPADHIVAHLLKRKFKCFWVADYRDLWSHYSLSTSRWLFNQTEKKIEQTVIKTADFLSTVSLPLANILQSSYQKPVTVIENGFEPETSNFSSLKDQASSTSQEKIRCHLLYTGSIYPNRRDPKALFQSLVHLDISCIERLTITFIGYETEYLLSLKNQYDFHDLVSIQGFIPREKCLELQLKSDILIFLDWNDSTIEGILTGKLFEYMASGTPIINIGCDHSTEASRLIDATGIGINLGNDPQAIGNYLSTIINGKKPYYQPNFEIIEQYSRKKLALKFLEQILIAYQQKTVD